MAKNHITLFYDVVSPFTYMGLECLGKLKTYYNADITLEPFFLGGIMETTGNKPPAAVPNKGAYMKLDLIRYAAITGVPHKHPSMFPAFTLPTQRLLRVIKAQEPDRLHEASLALARAYFVEDRDIGQPAVMVSALEFLGKGRVQQWLDVDCKSPKIKEELVAVTKRAMENGCFGSPWWEVKRGRDGKEDKYFGCDRFEHMAEFLEVPYPGLRAFTEYPKSKL
ncbi:hypothetical protein BZG36_01844 [Bifiguratus adelaidae]|uniref:Glutathione S-transferase kappa n=1 Tax=Bifiguratus adelaidae TaxID=1938954 RepID=A0A261Y2C1_9FUNG|nr:hypothetical protein BZG36_01844 [Bifiguratus adelaidae]